MGSIQNWCICLNCWNKDSVKLGKFKVTFCQCYFQSSNCLHYIQKKKSWIEKYITVKQILTFWALLGYNPESKIIFFSFSWILFLGRNILTTVFPKVKQFIQIQNWMYTPVSYCKNLSLECVTLRKMVHTLFS